MFQFDTEKTILVGLAMVCISVIGASCTSQQKQIGKDIISAADYTCVIIDGVAPVDSKEAKVCATFEELQPFVEPLLQARKAAALKAAKSISDAGVEADRGDTSHE